MNGMTSEDLKKLSVTERLDLLEKIWDSLQETPDPVPLTDAQRKELDRRVEHLKRDPDAVESWEKVQEYVRQRKRPE
ncbi:MAG: addiction module protein [Planctomycetota bacterium]|nr:addiction module protein [Planctomycetota bacterium]